MKTTLPEKFAELRNAKVLTMADIARECSLTVATISNVENGRPVRWETLHSVLMYGLGIKRDSDDYRAFHDLWLDQRAAVAKARRPGASNKALSRHAAEAVYKFRALVRDLDPERMMAVMQAVKRAVKK